MANLFMNIPVLAANGAGAAVDVSTLGKTKTFVCGGGPLDATVNLEYATDAGGVVWAPLATFQQPGEITVAVAARWIRAVTSAYKRGTPNIDVGASDAGAVFALLPADGSSVDISALPLFKSVVAPSGFAGNIEISEDGVAWSQVFSFQNGGGKSRGVYGQFARVGSGDDAVTIGGAADAGGGSSSAESLLSIYGDGSFGDHVTAGDETWTSLAGAPGAPAVPVGSPLPFAFFDNLTISEGDSVTVGGLSTAATERAVVIFVRATLTIEAGGRIHVNGGAGATGIGGGGAGRNAIIGSENGGDGADGNPAFAAGPGVAGTGGVDRPALSSATRVGGTGGAGDTGSTAAGGAGGADAADPSWPYSLSMAFSISSLLTSIGGGNGGGSGGNGANGNSGSGGGGAGTLVIFARTIVAPAGSLQAIGGAGAVATTSENQPSGGGGGGTGGTILIVTDNTTLLGVTDVSGGAGGNGAGSPAPPGTAGGDGEAIAFNPMLAAQIPV